MPAFREHTPKRRNILTPVNHHSEHKENLKIDFKGRCGYCNSIDSWSITFFEIDHFVPQKILKTIPSTHYLNLVYSCRSCNNAKRAKWPTNNEKIHAANDCGFIDPCDDNYNNQFERLENGRIKYKTALGAWMYNALKFYKPQHEIIWNIEQADKLIEEIEFLFQQKPNEELEKKLYPIYKEFRNYVKQLHNG